jgi:hypothetical protein
MQLTPETAVIITGASPSGEYSSRKALWLCCIDANQGLELKPRV